MLKRSCGIAFVAKQMSPGLCYISFVTQHLLPFISYFSFVAFITSYFHIAFVTYILKHCIFQIALTCYLCHTVFVTLNLPQLFFTLHLSHCISHIAFCRIAFVTFYDPIAFVTLHLSCFIWHILFVILPLPQWIGLNAFFTLPLSNGNFHIAFSKLHLSYYMCPNAFVAFYLIHFSCNTIFAMFHFSHCIWCIAIYHIASGILLCHIVFLTLRLSPFICHVLHIMAGVWILWLMLIFQTLAKISAGSLRIVSQSSAHYNVSQLPLWISNERKWTNIQFIDQIKPTRFSIFRKYPNPNPHNVFLFYF